MLEDSQTSRPPSPADTLRRAAALMRERAEAARGALSNIAEQGSVPATSGAAVVILGHYFTWHPAVALAVADWLDATEWSGLVPERRDHFALAVARAYLGESA